MATQTGSIDLTASNAVKLAAEASVDNKLTNYATHAELTVSANNIKSEVAETYATKDEAALELSKSGTVVVLDEAADARLKALTVHGKSVQDGTPSPSAPVPIRSVSKENLLLFTDNPEYKGSFYNWTDGTQPTGWYSWRSDPTITTTSDSIRFQASSAAADALVIPFSEPPKPNTYYNISFAYRGTVEVAQIYVLCRTSPNAVVTGTYLDKSGEWTWFERSIQWTNDFSARKPFALMIPYTTNAQGWLEIKFGSMTMTEGYAPSAYAPYGSVAVASQGKNTCRAILNWNSSSANGNALFVMADLRPSTTYTLSFVGAVGHMVYTNGGIVTQQSSITCTGERQSVTFTTKDTLPETQNPYGWLLLKNSSGNTVMPAFSDVQLEIGSTATPYQPYEGDTYPIDLQGNSPRSLPDGTRDELRVEGGRKVLVKRVGEVTFDGSETWMLYTASTYGEDFYTAKPQDCPSSVYGSRVTSNIAAGSNFNSSQQDKVNISSTGNVNFAVGRTLGITSVPDWKTWLASNNVTLLYPLAAPQEIDLGKIDLPYVSDGDSVWVDAQVTPNIDVAYWSKNGETVSALSSTLTQTAAGLELELQGKVDSDEEWVSWMHAGTDATTHEPYLAMGQDSDYPSVVYGSDAARFYDGEGDADSNVVASFGAGGARIGRIGAAHQTQTSTQSLTYGPDGELVIVTKYQPITDSVSGNSKYGTRVTDEGNISYIDIYPAVSSSGFNDRLNLSAYMNNIDLSTTSGSELHLDNTYASIEAMETVSGTTYDNGLTLGFDSQNGYAPKISFSGTGAQAAWLAALGLTVEQSNMTYARGLNSSYGSAPVRKYGSFGILKLNSVRLASQLASGGSVVIGTLPTGYVPVGSVDMHINIESNSSNYRNNYIIIEYSGSTNPGRVTLYNRSGYAIPNTVTFSCTCPFFI